MHFAGQSNMDDKEEENAENEALEKEEEQELSEDEDDIQGRLICPRIFLFKS